MIKLDINIRSKSYAAYSEVILRDLQVSVAAGEFVSVIGPSGTGKTTLLNIIGGLDTDYEGDIEFDHQRVRETEVIQSYMFQEPRLMPWLTVEDNIYLVMGDLLNKRDVVQNLICDVELAGYETAYPLQLSGGMQRRVALARAFSIQPQLLLMDEPFVSLDIPTAGRLRDYLTSIWIKNKPTVIFVTHDVREAILLSDRIIFLSKKPANIIKEINIDVERPRRIDSVDVMSLYDALLNEHSELLEGVNS